MKSARHLLRVIALLSVLLVVTAQCFGGRVSFLCSCSGAPIHTQASHCHGPRGADCHTDDAPVDPWHDADGTHNERGTGERQDHQVITHEVEFRPVPLAAQILAPQVLLAVLPVVPMLLPEWETKLPLRYGENLEESPPLGVAVARTVVLLI